MGLPKGCLPAAMPHARAVLCLSVPQQDMAVQGRGRTESSESLPSCFGGCSSLCTKAAVCKAVFVFCGVYLYTAQGLAGKHHWRLLSDDLHHETSYMATSKFQ